MAIELKAEERELLLEELSAFTRAVPEEAQPRYVALSQSVVDGQLPDEALGVVGEMLEVGLQTGRIRKIHRASGEQALLRLYGKTPSGQAQAAALADVNRALAELNGQEIESVRVLTRTPGTHLVQVSTDSLELTLRFGPDGVSIESVGLGV